MSSTSDECSRVTRRKCDEARYGEASDEGTGSVLVGERSKVAGNGVAVEMGEKLRKALTHQ